MRPTTKSLGGLLATMLLVGLGAAACKDRWLTRAACCMLCGPNGVASIDFAGAGADAAGKAIPGTYYRWTAVQGAQQTVLCAGSDIGPGTSPAPSPTTGGFTTRTDCSSFTRKLINKVPGTSPPILIRLEVRDPAGVIGEASVTIFLVTPPNH